MGRPIKQELRPYTYTRTGIWRSNVRGPKSKTTFVGTYPTKEAAIAAANHYIATGAKPAPGMFGGATRRGPKNGPRLGTVLKRHNSTAKTPLRTRTTRKPSKALQQPPAHSIQSVKLSHEDRVALWRAAYQKVQAS